jgi:hypothetical protein
MSASERKADLAVSEAKTTNLYGAGRKGADGSAAVRAPVSTEAAVFLREFDDDPECHPILPAGHGFRCLF